MPARIGRAAPALGAPVMTLKKRARLLLVSQTPRQVKM